ncbi:MAG: NADH-quinone oxidoreductase subunit C [Chloroflexota bacterium]
MSEQEPQAGADKTPAERPARHGPPVAEAPQVLDARGQASAKLLAQAAGAHALASGGGHDTPWVRVASEHLVDVAKRLRDGAFGAQMLHLIAAVDYEERIEVNYLFLSATKGHTGQVKVDVSPDAPELPSLTGLWTAAGWFERETHDLFGVVFEGNPDLSPLLLYEGFEGHPGLRSYPFNDYQEW